MAFDQAPEAEQLKLELKVAANSFGDFYPGRIYEITDDGIIVAWDSSGVDTVALAAIRIRMNPRHDPRPTPPPPPPSPAASSAPAPTNGENPPVQAATPSARPASPAAAARPAPDDDMSAALGGILGSVGDKYPMKYSLQAPSKSEVLQVKNELADISLIIPPDYIPTGVDFKIINKSGRPLTIDWSKSYLTSFAGVRRGIIHNNYYSMEQIPAVETPVVLPAGGNGTFSLIPRDGITWVVRPAHWEDSKWIEKYSEILNMSLFFGPDLPNALSDGYTEADKARDLELRKRNVVGKSFKVGIALVSAGKPSVVEFTVRIDSLDKAHEASFLDSIGN